MRINRKNLLWILVNLALLVLIYLIKNLWISDSLKVQIRAVGILSIIILCITIIMVFSVKKKLDCFSIFFVLAFFFMFSQHCLVILNCYPSDIMILSHRVSQSALYDTGFLVLESLILLNIGYLLVSKSQKNQLEISERSIDISRKSIYYAGLYLFFISLIPTIMILSRNIYLTFTVGYGERMLNESYRVSGINNTLGILASFMVPALLALFISRNKEQKWIVYIMAIYMLLYTLSGSRINTMILLVGVFYIQNTFFSKINTRKIIKYSAAIFVLFFVFSLVSSVRSNINETSSLPKIVAESSKDIVENNVIIATLTEVGYTFLATATVIDKCPNPEPYQYGASYISGIAYIIPNGLMGNIYNKIGSTDENFKRYLNTYGSGIGSSFIAEAYWNFGYGSLVLMIAFGFILGKLSLSVEEAMQNYDYSKIFLLMYAFITIVFYVRSDTRTFFRNFIWFGLPFVVIATFIRQKLKKNYKKDET